jgi:hypothetical protein
LGREGAAHHCNNLRGFKKETQSQPLQHFLFKVPKEGKLSEQPSEKDQKQLVNGKDDQDPNGPIKEGKDAPFRKDGPNETQCFKDWTGNFYRGGARKGKDH